MEIYIRLLVIFDSSNVADSRELAFPMYEKNKNGSMPDKSNSTIKLDHNI